MVFNFPEGTFMWMKIKDVVKGYKKKDICSYEDKCPIEDIVHNTTSTMCQLCKYFKGIDVPKDFTK